MAPLRGPPPPPSTENERFPYKFPYKELSWKPFPASSEGAGEADGRRARSCSQLSCPSLAVRCVTSQGCSILENDCLASKKGIFTKCQIPLTQRPP